jgi:glucans biosynthesis protein
LNRLQIGQSGGRILIGLECGLAHHRHGARRYVVDVTGAPDGLRPEITAPATVAVEGVSVFALPDGRGTRLTFLLLPGEGIDAADIRVALHDDSSPVPSVWVHRWTRTRDGGV